MFYAGRHRLSRYLFLYVYTVATILHGTTWQGNHCSMRRRVSHDSRKQEASAAMMSTPTEKGILSFRISHLSFLPCLGHPLPQSRRLNGPKVALRSWSFFCRVQGIFTLAFGSPSAVLVADRAVRRGVAAASQVAGRLRMPFSCMFIIMMLFIRQFICLHIQWKDSASEDLKA